MYEYKNPLESTYEYTWIQESAHEFVKEFNNTHQKLIITTLFNNFFITTLLNNYYFDNYIT